MHGAMTNEGMDVLELLASQHEEVDDLIERIETGDGDKAALFEELANKLAAHATIEEKIFYPAVLRADTEELLREAGEEHLAVKRVLADLLELDPDEDEAEFDAKLSVLKEEVEHHAHEEEEEKLFPLLRRTMSEDDLLGLGNECLVMFEALMEGEPSRKIAGETDRAAPLEAS
jgi:hypothetical protein